MLGGGELLDVHARRLNADGLRGDAHGIDQRAGAAYVGVRAGCHAAQQASQVQPLAFAVDIETDAIPAKPG
ncbi:hypothetical protein D3C78_1572290 [compost metagenome]